jgi:pimeloyl-ACP methyl ester carboxylesterase
MKRLCTFLLLIRCFAANAEAEEPQFQSEEITFTGMGEVSLSGSLTLPDGKGPYPVIVLLGGSERLGRRAIYNWANADSFVSQGIAVFCFDSPGTGKSAGNRWGRTHQERTDDSLAAIRAIQEREDIDRGSIGLYGVSEGGSIVFRAASLSKDIAFGVAVSAPAVPHYQVMNSLIKTLSTNTGLEGVEIEKLVTFNLLLSDLVQNRSALNYAELERTVAAWNDPGWKELISLVRNKTDRNREATIESYITLAQRWEGEHWFRGNRMLKEFYKQVTDNLGITLADLGIDTNEQDSARGHVEFASAVVTKVIGSDSSRDEDPVSFLKEIKCPMLCIYGELDQGIPASESAGIIRNVFADTRHNDFVVEVFPGAGHQLEITEGNRTHRHKDFDNFILDWIQERVREN